MKRINGMLMMMAAAGVLAVVAAAVAVGIANPPLTSAQGSGLTFGQETISNQTFVQWRWISEVVLPEATGGSGSVEYSLNPTLQGGLRFIPATRKLTGRPSMLQREQTYTYTATDNAGNTASLDFTISVTGVSPLSSPLAVQDSYNRHDTSMYTNLIVAWKLDHSRVPDGFTVQSYKVEASASESGPWEDVTSNLSKVLEIEHSTFTYYEYRHTGLNPGDSRFYRITTSYTSGEETLPITTSRKVSTLSVPTPSWTPNHKIWTYPGAVNAQSQPDWSPLASGVKIYLQAVHFVDANTGWAVGDDGTILRTTDGGTNWSTQSSGTTVLLRDVHFTGASKGWAVGENGTILHTTDGGTNWSAQSSGTTQFLKGVHFTDASKGWAVGENGTILHTTDGGTNWSAQSSGTIRNVTGVDFIDASKGWAVGNNGTILHTTDGGTNWSAQSTGSNDALTHVDFIDASKGWAVGSQGAILRTTDGGANWSPQSSGTTQILMSVHFVDASKGWAVGFGGTILRTTDGGANWSPQSSGTNLKLADVDFVDASKGWAVGFDGTILTYPGEIGSLQVWWNAPNGVPAALWDHRTYTLQSKIGSGSWTDVATGLTSARYLHRGLEPETTVTYRVKATISNDDDGWTAVDTGWSGEFESTTDAPPPPPLPAAPGKPDVSVTVTETTVTLSWPAVTYSDNSSSSEGDVLYTIERVSDDGQSWVVLSERQRDLTYSHTGLSAGDVIEYIVQAVVKVKARDEYVQGRAWVGRATTSASSGASGASGTGDDDAQEASPGQSGGEGAGNTETPAVSFVIYHDPGAGAGAVDRYSQATKLLSDAGISYAEVIGDVQDAVDRLAGVTNSVMPRFFLGDPTDSDWVSEPRKNNGGLRWLKGKVDALSGD